MILDWPSLDELKLKLSSMGPQPFIQAHRGPVLFVCGIMKASFTQVDNRRTRALTAMPDLDAVLKPARLVINKVISLQPTQGDAVTIGSHPNADVMVPDLAVSRVHCEFRIGEVAVELTDRNSANGTWVNGERIPSDEAVALTELDLVAVGRYHFRLFDSAATLILCPDPMDGVKVSS